jgi:hypothetical protein
VAGKRIDIGTFNAVSLLATAPQTPLANGIVRQP